MQQLKCDQEHVEVVFVVKAMLIYIYIYLHNAHEIMLPAEAPC